MENDLIEEMRRTLPDYYRDAFDKFVVEYRDQVANEYQDTIDAMRAELDCGQINAEIEEALRKVRDWFFDVLEMHKLMSDPRKIYEMVERALRS